MSGDQDKDYRKQVADAAASLDANDLDDLTPEEIDALDAAAGKARKNQTCLGQVEGPDLNAKQKPLPVSDFIAFSPRHTYIHRSTGEVWTATAVNARVLPVEVGGEPLAA
jgi:hypothetical protein